MQGWIVAGVWLFAAAVALIVLGFACYELSWKVARLQSDRAKLEALLAELVATGGALQAAADRTRHAVRSDRQW